PDPAPPPAASSPPVYDAAIPIDAAAPPPEVTFATATMSDGISIYRTGPRGVQLVHRVPPSGRGIDALAWTGPDALYALVEDGVVARVSGDALVPVPLPPARTWRVPPPADEARAREPDFKLVAADAAPWLRRCHWAR